MRQKRCGPQFSAVVPKEDTEHASSLTWLEEGEAGWNPAGWLCAFSHSAALAVVVSLC